MDDVTRKLKTLELMTYDQLRQVWNRHFKYPPPVTTTEYLHRAIAWQMQAEIHGGLSLKTRNKLKRIASGEQKIALPKYLPTPGTRLLRDFHGRRIEVIVKEDGFEYDGRHYDTLTAIAREIAGCEISGPAFFGLKRGKKGMKPTRCAVYTRKSTDEGLEKEFNSLEAQREAGEAFIKSQKHEGWHLIETAYDDGGYGGSTMERPALTRLFDDVRAGEVDTVVVYKVDRISRSLHDFARMVDLFEKHNVSFVSVTQQFNTTSSMGRLTLNILLSFAQFEREVIGERVRDKFAASKQRGMWMGGFPPLGYDIIHRKLIINDTEASLVRTIFEKYIETKSSYATVDWLNQQGHHAKRWTNGKGVERGGVPFAVNTLCALLKNPVYTGKITHKGKTYEGQHDAILAPSIWEQAQQLMNCQRVRLSGRKNSRLQMLLTGKCVDVDGHPYTPTYTAKNPQTHYRYYVNKATKHRIAAGELEALVFNCIRSLTGESSYWQSSFRKAEGLVVAEAQQRWSALWTNWPQASAARQREIVDAIIERVIITQKSLVIRLLKAGIAVAITKCESTNERSMSSDVPAMPPMTIEGRDASIDITLDVSFHRRRRNVMAFDGRDHAIELFRKQRLDPPMITAIAKAFCWHQQLIDGQTTITAIAQKEKVARTYVSRVLSLVWLAPDITDAILAGTQPRGLRLKDILSNLPVQWDLQSDIYQFLDVTLNNAAA